MRLNHPLPVLVDRQGLKLLLRTARTANFKETRCSAVPPLGSSTTSSENCTAHWTTGYAHPGHTRGHQARGFTGILEDLHHQTVTRLKGARVPLVRHPSAARVVVVCWSGGSVLSQSQRTRSLRMGEWLFVRSCCKLQTSFVLAE